jgi:hypothetical protein
LSRTGTDESGFCDPAQIGAAFRSKAGARMVDQNVPRFEVYGRLALGVSSTGLQNDSRPDDRQCVKQEIYKTV